MYKIIFIVLSLSLFSINLSIMNSELYTAHAALCVPKDVSPRFVGVYVRGNAEDHLWANAQEGVASLVAFQKQVNLERHNGFGLIDVDPIRTNVGTKIFWAGVWQKGNPTNEFHAGLNLLNFRLLDTQLKKKGLGLIDASPYKDYSGKVWWAGVWGIKGKDSIFLAHLTLPEFGNKDAAYYKLGYVPVDIEAYYVDSDSHEPGKLGLMWAGIWQKGHGLNYFYVDRDWNTFKGLSFETHQKGFHLIDVTTYENPNPPHNRLWAGTWIEHGYGNAWHPYASIGDLRIHKNIMNNAGYHLVDIEPYMQSCE